MIKRYLLKSSISTIIVVVSACLIAFTNLAMAQQSNSNSRGAMSAILQLLLEENTQPQCSVTESTTINGFFVVQSQSDLDAIRGVTKIDGNLFFTADELLDFSALDSLVEIGGLSIQSLSKLQTEMSGFNCLETADSIFIRSDLDSDLNGNSTLTTIRGFEKLNTIGGFFEVTDFEGLTQLPSFDALKTIDIDLLLISLPKLSEIPSFNSLTSVGGDVRFNSSDNMTLTEIIGFSSLNNIGGSKSIILGDNFDCRTAPAIFLPADNSFLNAHNCILVKEENSTVIAIRDPGSANVIDSFITVADGPTRIGRVELDLDISHGDTGDLNITLSNGVTTVALAQVGTFSNPDGIAYQSRYELLDEFDGDNSNTTWTLSIEDARFGSTGELRGWTLSIAE